MIRSVGMGAATLLVAMTLGGCGSSTKTSSQASANSQTSTPIQTSTSSSTSTAAPATSTATSTAPSYVAKVPQQDTARVVAQAAAIAELQAVQGGSQAATLIHQYQTEPASQRQATLQELQSAAPGCVKYGAFGGPSGVDVNSAGCQVSLEAGAGAGAIHAKAETAVSTVISVLTQAHAGLRTTMDTGTNPVTGSNSPTTVQSELDTMIKDLRRAIGVSD